ncbi:uncharacterized protein BYT42DRAFT_503276, partial [Radiomyces spectabilis]|uniref:uncharacterized protein n=1 Tax=Radiomyces spectabilis TaxID=64574 RepID=UPI00221F41CC
VEERISREKPCRTLFVRNIQYSTNVGEIKEVFDKFGHVKDIFNLIEKRGMAFITFYDLRAAEDAKKAMQNGVFHGRHIDVHYSLPKEEEVNSACDRTKNQGTLLVTLKDSDYGLRDDELYSYYSQFGDIKNIRTPYFKTANKNRDRFQRLIEYYDSRACVEAYDNTLDQPYKGGYWHCAFFWDASLR